MTVKPNNTGRAEDQNGHFLDLTFGHLRMIGLVLGSSDIVRFHCINSPRFGQVLFTLKRAAIAASFAK